MRKCFICQEPKGVFQGVFLGSHPANRANFAEMYFSESRMACSWLKDQTSERFPQTALKFEKEGKKICTKTQCI